jgi:processing peptidase subunit alpha
MAYTVDVVKTNVPEAVEILADSVLNPKFLPWEVAHAVEKMREDIKAAKENPQSVLLEVRKRPAGDLPSPESHALGRRPNVH